MRFSLANIQRFSVILNIVELEGPEELINHGMIFDITNELIGVDRSKSKLRFVFLIHAHVKSKDVFVKKLLTNH